MRKADLIAEISDKTGIAKVDVLVTLEAFFKERSANYFRNLQKQKSYGDGAAQRAGKSQIILE